MNDSHRCFFPLALAIAVAVLAGCGASQTPMGAVDTSPQISRGSSGNGYKVLHSFLFRHDGRTPKAGLTSMGGMLYGTTYTGGHYELGTVFRISTSGKEKVVHSFGGAYTNDGANPAASLLPMKHVLYGTTEYGGETNDSIDGTVFTVTTGGLEKVLYKFGYDGSKTNYDDGANPVAALINVKGTLYGTTYNGGTGSSGTVFSISPSGADYTILHEFGFNDGTNPKAGLLYTKGTFYGTTQLGPLPSSGLGAGTVFSMTPSGAEVLLFTFPPLSYGGSDGAEPQGAVISVGGKFYGTAAYLGAYSGGTAFSVTKRGQITILHNFGSGADGSQPIASLLNVNGTLYGTTSAGGAYGGGTIFSLSLSGTETILHSFGNGSDGATPLAGLIDVKGTLYGTTSVGGTQGYGTVFAIKP